MKNTDKLLIAIVVGVVILIGVAFTIALTQPKPAYQNDNTPQGVTHDYLLAMQQGDYERAYACLSPTVPGYPRSTEKFIDDANGRMYTYRSKDDSKSFEVLSADVKGNQATVKVRETTFRQGDLFSSGESTRTFAVLLIRNTTDKTWKIVRSDTYWAYCWNLANGCR